MPKTASPTDKSIDMGMMYVLHDGFRRDLGRFVHQFSGEASSQPARWSALQERWHFFEKTLHHHHSGEDDSIWPVMRTELSGEPEALAVLDAMESEHAVLGPLLEKVEAGFESSSPPAAADRQALAAALTELRDSLTAHLAHEERDAIPLILRAVPYPHWAEFENRQKRSLGLRGAAQFFPWALDEATPERRATVLGLLPAPLRLLVRGPWERSYRRSVRAAFG